MSISWLIDPLSTGLSERIHEGRCPAWIAVSHPTLLGGPPLRPCQTIIYVSVGADIDALSLFRRNPQVELKSLIFYERPCARIAYCPSGLRVEDSNCFEMSADC